VNGYVEMKLRLALALRRAAARLEFGHPVETLPTLEEARMRDPP
jgi:hypothetical protein